MPMNRIVNTVIPEAKMDKEPQKRAIRHEYADPILEVTIPSREQQWLDVVNHPAAPLAPRISPIEVPPVPEAAPADPDSLPVSEEVALEPHYSPMIRGIAIIVLTVLFLLAWQGQVGDESTVDRVRASQVLDG